MTVIGFNFTKINAEKSDTKSAKVNVGNNVSVIDVVDANIGSLSSDKQQAIKFVFEFVSKFDPEIGKITLVGDVIYLQEKEKTTAILDEWKKNKKIDKSLMTVILNTVLTKCNIQSLILSQEVGLPSPIPLPKIKTDEKTS